MKDQTIRCDGFKWVAVKNLWNDGTRVGVGSNIEPNVKLVVDSGDSKASILGSNTGTGVGVYALAKTFGMYSVATDPDGVGVSSKTLGPNGTAFKATTAGNSGYGFYQEGVNAKNYFEGKVGIGSNNFSSAGGGQKLNVVTTALSDSAIRADSQYTQAIEAYSTDNIAITASGAAGGIKASGAVGVIGQGSTGVRGVGGNIGVEAVAGQGNFGFYQDGGVEGKNLFEGSLTLGTPPVPPSDIVKLDVNGGGVRINTWGNLNCDANARGTFAFTQGGAGQADHAQVCAKTASSTYAWKDLF